MMLQEERFSNIIQYLKENKIAKLRQLSKLNGVSVDTVRRDLEILENYGVLEKVHGGAVYKQESADPNTFGMRIVSHRREKAELARGITSVVKEGQTVALGSGSTIIEIAKVFAESYKRLTVITNDLNVVDVLSAKENFTIILAGGVYNGEENAIFGGQCEQELGQYNADVGILSVGGISPDKGITDVRLEQIDVLRRIIDMSEKVVVAADHSKFAKVACSAICEARGIDIILSDAELSDLQKEIYEQLGITVIRT